MSNFFGNFLICGLQDHSGQSERASFLEFFLYGEVSSFKYVYLRIFNEELYVEGVN
jgi:hypothetical protein